jgi:hypothetical protein
MLYAIIEYSVRPSRVPIFFDNSVCWERRALARLKAYAELGLGVPRNGSNRQNVFLNYRSSAANGAIRVAIAPYKLCFAAK